MRTVTRKLAAISAVPSPASKRLAVSSRSRSRRSRSPAVSPPPDAYLMGKPYRRAHRLEGTIRQGIAVTGIRRARYRGLGKVHLEHIYSAVALNLIRLHAWWNGHPLDRRRTSHLARLDLTLAA